MSAEFQSTKTIGKSFLKLSVFDSQSNHSTDKSFFNAANDMVLISLFDIMCKEFNV